MYLVRDLTTVLSGNVNTLLFGDIVTDRVGNLLLLGLRHILALVVRILLAGPGDFSPDLVVTVTLPLELTVLLVLCRHWFTVMMDCGHFEYCCLTCGALCLSVRFILSLVLVNTHTFVNSGAALLVDGLTLLPGGGLQQHGYNTQSSDLSVSPHLTESLSHSVTNLLIVRHTLLRLLLLVLGVPHHAVLRPAGH